MRSTSCVSRRWRSPTCCRASSELAITIDADNAGAHDHDHRQRHRHEPRGGDRAPRHDRQVRHRRIPGAADRRPEEGRAADRPVRRRLLFFVHRRRARRGVFAPCRPSLPARACTGNRAATASSPCRDVELPERGTTHRAASEGRRARLRRRLSHPLAGAQVFRSHRLPGAHARSRQGATRTRRRSTKPSITRRRCGRGRAPK